MERLQIEAAWILTNVTPKSTESVAAVVNSDAIPVLTNLLSSKSDQVKEQVIWALGNIAGDSNEHCDQLLSRNVLENLLTLYLDLLSSSKSKTKTLSLILCDLDLIISF